MEARFVVNGSMDFETTRAFVKVHSARSKRRSYIKIAYYVIIAIIWWGVFHTLVIPLLVVLLAAIQLYQIIAYDSIMAKRILKNANPEGGENKYSFDEEAAYVRDAVIDSRLEYNAFVKAVETDDYFFLYISGNTAHCLPKKGFVTGDPAYFAAFISEKTGLEVQFV